VGINLKLQNRTHCGIKTVLLIDYLTYLSIFG
jgi:hypothetical protein